ncbi:MAG: conserved rane protein of unknown function, partial [Solirubrobacterales bacterium]|nr:conserved rane protein of unknown function [Solirubrobacterales bacterium]
MRPVSQPGYRHASSGGQIAIVGGFALLGGLVLLGLHYPILRLYEGYPLATASARRPWRWMYRPLMTRQNGRLTRARDRTTDTELTEAERFDARWRLDQYFPHDTDGLMLPTAFGNAVRAFERHSMTRWHLNSIGAWPAIEMLVSDQEAQVHSDVKADVAFFVNGSLVGLLTGLTLVADEIAHDHSPAWYLDVLLCALPFALAALAYVAAVGASVRRGGAERASIDIHSRELSDKLGLANLLDYAAERLL